MDPLTQGAIGAVVAATQAKPQQVSAALFLGALAGMAPDLDVLIRSESDSLLFLEYHRQFTHALFFIPFGALICTLVLHPLIGKRRGLSAGQTYLFCLLGYATHGLLDACTTYGTLLMWPFSDARVAWNTLSIIDPLVTLPLILGIGLSVAYQQRLPVTIATAYFAGYLVLGVVQRVRAEQVGWQIAAERGHSPIRLEAKPSFANIALFKVVYEVDHHFYVDAVHVGMRERVYQGESIAKLDVARDLPWLDQGYQQAIDIERFRWFSNDYLALDPDDANNIVDIRYSLMPNQIDALWSIHIDPAASPDQHAIYQTHRGEAGQLAPRLWSMILGRDV